MFHVTQGKQILAWHSVSPQAKVHLIICFKCSGLCSLQQLMLKGPASLPEHIQHRRNMKANEVQVAVGNLLIKKMKAFVGQSLQRKDEDSTEDRWHKRVEEGKVNRHTENETSNSKCKAFPLTWRERGFKNLSERSGRGESQTPNTEKQRECLSNWCPP